MKLTITTPLAIVAEASDVTYLRAEDATGAFGILPGHADFLTTLAISVVTWRQSTTEHHVAVRGGVLTVRDGHAIAIATPEAVSEETLARLGDAVLAKMRQDTESEEASRVSVARLELAAMRQIQRYIGSGATRLPPSQPAPTISARQSD